MSRSLCPPFPRDGRAWRFGLRIGTPSCVRCRSYISTIEDTTRYLLQKGERPLAVGFFFSLGHSTMVLIMTVALVIATKTVRSAKPHLQNYGSVIGATVSGVFLWLIGILN